MASFSWLEEFSLGNREEALKKLVPGSEDYYFYQILHELNRSPIGNISDEVEVLFKKYESSFPYSSRMKELKCRKMFQSFSQEAKTKDKQEFFTWLRQELNLSFNHNQEVSNVAKPATYPSKLEPSIGVFEVPKKGRIDPNAYDASADEFLIHSPLLTPHEMNRILSRLQKPDIENLPNIIAKTFEWKEFNVYFGYHAIHRKLTLAQLEKLKSLRPSLIDDGNYVQCFIERLQPNPDVDWESNEKETIEYFQRLKQFVFKLSAAFNSEKLTLLYHILEFDRKKGVYDDEKFIEYIQFPRYASYSNNDYLKKEDNRKKMAQFNHSIGLLKGISNDEELVRDYLLHFFVKADNIKPYSHYLSDSYLQPLFAEAKLVNMIGNAEKFLSGFKIDVKNLNERVDIEFAATNPKYFGPDDIVSLDVYIKNVPKLYVKVFEINTTNYYKEKGQEISSNINLDGLVANFEQTYSFKEPPMHRVLRTFEFSNLKRGVYVIELIGNGKSNRAVIRKGQLNYLERYSVAGHVFTIVDEMYNKVVNASIWIKGHHYTAGSGGTITVPYSTAPTNQQILLQSGDFCSLSSFYHKSEDYTLFVGFYVDRESLIKSKRAQLLVRARLYVNGVSAPLSILKDINLEITSYSEEDVKSERIIPNFQLFEDQDSVYEIQIPESLKKLKFTLRAKVEVISQNRKADLEQSREFELNYIDNSEAIEDEYLEYSNNGYVFSLLGKTGEPKKNRIINFSLKNRLIIQPIFVTLQTNDQGQIELGMLEGIEWVKGSNQKWELKRDYFAHVNSIHAQEGETIFIPFFSKNNDLKPSDLSFLELRNGSYLRDCFKTITYANSYLEIKNLTSGTYELYLKQEKITIHITISAGKQIAQYICSENKIFEKSHTKPIQISSIKTSSNKLTINLENYTKNSRIHVICARFYPSYDWPSLFSPQTQSPLSVTTTKPSSQYLKERDISEEYKYILERKHMKVYNGNMLPRPSLLLDPWAVGKTQTEKQDAASGGEYDGKREMSNRSGGRAAPSQPSSSVVSNPNYSNIDFIASPSFVKYNLKPQDNGLIELDLPEDDLGGSHIRVLAVDGDFTVFRQFGINFKKAKVNDIRLLDNALESTKHFTEQKQISVVDQNKPFTIQDILTSKFEIYNTLTKVYQLFLTLSGNTILKEFDFIQRWNLLKFEEKCEKYSKYACHELSFFIYKKDSPFFESVVAPYLKNKKEKQFMDYWLLNYDMRFFLQPNEFSKLNIAEKLLLASRIPQEGTEIEASLKDLFETLPTTTDNFEQIFKTALSGRSLETTDLLGIEAQRERARFAAKERLIEAVQIAKPQMEKATMSARSIRMEMPKMEAMSSGSRMKKKNLAPMMARSLASPASFGSEPPMPPPMEMAYSPEMDYLDEEEMSYGEDSYQSLSEEMIAADLSARELQRQFYQKLDTTEEYAETHYYRIRLRDIVPSLITINSFWADYAHRNPKIPFVSKNFAVATRNFPEMMFALSLLDLPFTEEKDSLKVSFEDTTMKLVSPTPLIIFHKEIKSAKVNTSSVLVSQNFFDPKNRYIYEKNEKIEKYVNNEFLINTVYGCQVVITNVSCSRQQLEVLLQIPTGSIPVKGGSFTRGRVIELSPYSTQTLEYYFYFPFVGKYQQFPVHIAKNEEIIAFTQPPTIEVVENPTVIDTTSFEYVSQRGSNEELYKFLQSTNLHRINLNRIAWRLKDKSVFTEVMKILKHRFIYHDIIWSYSIFHENLVGIQEYLSHLHLISKCGPHLVTPLLSTNPFTERTFEHLEYLPLVNARAFTLGKERKILNNRFREQYSEFLRLLSYKNQLDRLDLLEICYYLLLQDRIEEAKHFFHRISPQEESPQKPAKIQKTSVESSFENLQGKTLAELQYDYMAAYLDFYEEKPQNAEIIASRYLNYPVDKWRKKFLEIIKQLKEISGTQSSVAVDPDSRDSRQSNLAEKAPSLEISLEAKKLTIQYQNLVDCTVNFYSMDLELMFSTNPFVSTKSSQFSYIKPNAKMNLNLPQDQSSIQVDIPQQFHNSNIIVEVSSGGLSKSEVHYSHSLNVQVIENYGQLKVTDKTTGQPLPRIYIKVYCRNQGVVSFYKDGHTDLRGRFDYSSLSTDEIKTLDRFAILVMSDEKGALVREANPPKM